MLNQNGGELNNGNNENFRNLGNNPKHNSDSSLNTSFTRKQIEDVDLSHTSIHLPQIYANTPISQESYNTLLNILPPSEISAFVISVHDEMQIFSTCHIDIDVFWRNYIEIVNTFNSIKESDLTIDDKSKEIEKYLSVFGGNFEAFATHINSVIENEEYREYLKNTVLKILACTNHIDELLEARNDDEYTINLLRSALEKMIFISSFFVPSLKEESYTEINGLISTISNNQEEEQINNDIYTYGESLKYFTPLSNNFIHSLITRIDKLKSDFLSELDPISIKDAKEICDAIQNYSESILSEVLKEDTISISQDKHDIILKWKFYPLYTNQITNNQDKLVEKLLPIKELLNELGGDLKINFDQDNYTISVIITCPKQEEEYIELSKFCSNDDFYESVKGRALIFPSSSIIKFRVPYDTPQDRLEKLDETNSYEIMLDKKCMQSEINRLGVINLLSNINSLNSNNSLSHVAITYRDTSPIVILKYNSTINGEMNDEHISNIDCEKFICGKLYVNNKFCGDDAVCALNLPIFADERLFNEFLLMTKFYCRKIVMNIDDERMNSLYVEFVELNKILSKLNDTEGKYIDFSKTNVFPAQVTISKFDTRLLFKGSFLSMVNKYCGRLQTDLTSYDYVLAVLDNFAKKYLEDKTCPDILDIVDNFITDFSNTFKSHNIFISNKYLENLKNGIVTTQVRDNAKIFDSIYGYFRYGMTCDIYKDQDKIIIETIDEHDLESIAKHIIR